MPRRLTPEEKIAAFENFLKSNEYNSIKKFSDERKKIQKSGTPLELGTLDISNDFQPFLNSLWQMVQDLRVPGKKAKGKLQFSIF